MTNDKIEITKTVARWIVRLGRQLVSDGIGRDWNPMNDIDPIEEDFPGYLDDIPDHGSDTWVWAQALVQFVRAVASIAARELRELGDGTPTILNFENDIDDYN